MSSSNLPQKQLAALLNNLQNLLTNLNNLLQSTNLTEIYFEFQILILKFQNFKINFKNYLVFPHLLLKSDPDFYPRVLLRTKMSEEVENWVKDCFAPMEKTSPEDGREGNRGSTNGFGDLSNQSQPEESLSLEEQAEEYEKTVEWTVDSLIELRQEIQSLLVVKPRRSIQKKVKIFTNI